MDTLNRLNGWMSHHMPLLILCALGLGLLFPDQLGTLCPYITAMMVFQTFANTLGAGFRDLARVLLHPGPVLLTMAALHMIMPLIALGLGTLCFPDQPLYVLSMVLEESSPAAVSSLLWMVIGGGNVELCLSVVLLDSLLSPVIMPLTLRLLCGSVVALDTAGMIEDLLIMVVLPAAVAMLLHQFAGKAVCTRLKERLGLLPKVLLLVIISANMTRCVPFLRHLDGTLLLLTVLTLVMRVLGLVTGWILGRLCRFPYETGLTVTVNSSMRNNAVAGTLAAQYFPAEVVFSPSISPMFSQICVSLAVRLLQRHRSPEE